MLHTEDSYVNTQVQLISNGVTLRYCRPNLNKSQAIVIKSWSELIAGDISARVVKTINLCICEWMNIFDYISFFLIFFF